MDQKINPEGLVEPLLLDRKPLNGISGLLPALGTQDVNKNAVHENVLTRTVEHVIRGLDSAGQVHERQSVIAGGPATLNAKSSSSLSNQASQMLKAAAAASVSIREGDMALHTPYGSDYNNVTTQGTRTITYSGYETSLSQSLRPSMISSDCSTSLAFSSKTTMSTGLSDAIDSGRPSVLPSPMNSATNLDLSASVRNTQQLLAVTTSAQHITNQPLKEIPVPFLWQRVNDIHGVNYISPTGTKLSSLSEVKKYLLSDDSCKCGLVCPFHVEKVFNFDRSYQAKVWQLSDLDQLAEQTKMPCCHRKHLKSQTLAEQCRNAARAIKSSPVKRRVKSTTSNKRSTASKAAGKKSRTNSASNAASMASNADETSVGAAMSAPTLPQAKPLISPLPSVEVVASQLRSARGLEMPSTSPHFSPLHVNSALSPRLLSPGREHHHMLPSPYASLSAQLPSHAAYHQLAYPMHRPPMDPGFGLGSSSGHYQPPLHYAPGSAYPYHPGQSAYEYLAATGHVMPPVSWGSPPPHMMSHNPNNTQFVPPMWPATKHEPLPPPSSASSGGAAGKKKRKTSGKSSSGLTSPPAGAASMLSPPAPPSKTSSSADKKDDLTESIATTVIKSTKQSSTADTSEHSRPKKKKSAEPSASDPMAVRGSAQPSVKSPTSNPQSGGGWMLPGSGGVMPGYLPHNGRPSAAYMDPMYIPGQHHMTAGHFRPPIGAPHAMAMFPPGPPHPYLYRPHIHPGHMSHDGNATKVSVASSSATAASPAIVADKEKGDSIDEKPEMKSAAIPSGDSPMSHTSSGSHTAASTANHALVNGIRKTQMAGGRPPSTEPSVLSHPATHHAAMYMMPPSAAPPNPMYYRYYEPQRYHNPAATSSAQPMYYQHHQIHPSMYPPPHPSHLSSIPHPYGPQLSPPAASPKRKRRKAVSKAAIESHSALLAGSNESVTVTTGETGNKAPTSPVDLSNGVIKQMQPSASVNDETTPNTSSNS